MQYYVYQCDLVKGIEDLRTPLQVAIDLEKQIRGTISGFNMPSFVIDLPGGGGKRLVSTHESYENGVAIYRAPGLTGDKGTRDYTYHDPKPMSDAELVALRDQRVKQRELERSHTVVGKDAEARSGCGCGDTFVPAPKPVVKPSVEREEKKKSDVQPGILYGWSSNGSNHQQPVAAYACGPQ